MSTRDPTSGDDSGSEPQGPDLEAAEYALGVQDAAQRRRSQARIDADPVFAEDVAAWEQRLGGLFDGIAPVDPPTHIWPRIRTRLGWPAVEGARGGLWNSVAFWRAAAAGALVAATTLVVLDTVREAPPQVPPMPLARAVTTLAFDDGTPAYLATLDADTGTILLVPVPRGADPQGRVPELWLIPAGEGPSSLGVVATDEARSVAVPVELRRAMTPGSTLAISLEPQGGSPEAVPTGPIVAKGSIETI